MLQIEVGRVTNDEEHELALARINVLWDRTDTDAIDEMNIITMLVDTYERERWPMDDPGDPVDIIKGAIEHAGHTQKDLARLLGSASRASEILSRKRGLTLDMIRTISKAWGIPESLLTRAYELQTDTVTLKVPKQTVVAKMRRITDAPQAMDIITSGAGADYKIYSGTHEEGHEGSLIVAGGSASVTSLPLHTYMEVKADVVVDPLRTTGKVSGSMPIAAVLRKEETGQKRASPRKSQSTR